MPLTFDQAYSSLSSYAPPTTEQFIQVLNEVCERLLTSGKWLGTTQVIDFDASQGRIALPKEFSTILAAQINERAGRVFGRFHEYLIGGPGRINTETGVGLSMLVDEGDGFPTEKELETPARLVVQTFSAADAFNPLDPNTIGKMYVTGFGTDTAQTGANEMLELEVPLPTPSTPFVSTEVFSRITSIIKPVTTGDVAIYAFGETNPLSVFTPTDTVPSFRRYKVSSLNPDLSVRAVCKRRFVPLAGDKDELVVPSNLGALKLGMLAVNYENKNDLERAQDFWGKAFSTLNLEMRESRGGAQMRGQIDPAAFQMGRLRNFY